MGFGGPFSAVSTVFTGLDSPFPLPWWHSSLSAASGTSEKRSVRLRMSSELGCPSKQGCKEWERLGSNMHWEHGSREQQMEKQFRFQDLEIWQKAAGF